MPTKKWYFTRNIDVDDGCARRNVLVTAAVPPIAVQSLHLFRRQSLMGYSRAYQLQMVKNTFRHHFDRKLRILGRWKYCYVPSRTVNRFQLQAQIYNIFEIIESWQIADWNTDFTALMKLVQYGNSYKWGRRRSISSVNSGKPFKNEVKWWTRWFLF